MDYVLAKDLPTLKAGVLFMFKCGCYSCQQEDGNMVQYFKQDVEDNPEWFTPVCEGTGKPPVGLMPKKIYQEHRADQIHEAMVRYSEADKPIPMEWIDEYNELLKMLI